MSQPWEVQYDKDEMSELTRTDVDYIATHLTIVHVLRLGRRCLGNRSFVYEIKNKASLNAMHYSGTSLI